MPSSLEASRRSNHYDILQLPRNVSSTLTSEDVKNAYHRALLLHHPDKARNLVANSPSPPTLKTKSDPEYSVDEIIAAYQTLSDPTRRSAYDETLSRRTGNAEEDSDKGTHIGVEVFDLEDLKFNERANTWHHGCRCGDEEGYQLSEVELETASEHGEIYVGCNGCSLFIKVLFGAAEEAAQAR